jgi:hypothetical protein
MAVKPIPKADLQKKSIDEFINKGGKVADEKNEDEWVLLTQRLPKYIVNEIDERRKHFGWISRNAWIFLVIQKALNEGITND